MDDLVRPPEHRPPRTSDDRGKGHPANKKKPMNNNHAYAYHKRNNNHGKPANGNLSGSDGAGNTTNGNKQHKNDRLNRGNPPPNRKNAPKHNRTNNNGKHDANEWSNNERRLHRPDQNGPDGLDARDRFAKKRKTAGDPQSQQPGKRRNTQGNPNQSHGRGNGASSPRPILPAGIEVGKITYTDEPPFEFLAQVGQGTYGKVYKAVERRTSKQLAMKRLRLELNHEGFPITAAREIKLLQICKHQNIVHLCEIVVAKSEVYMALDYIQNDLAGLLLNKQLLISPANSKSLIRQVLSGLGFLHGKQVLHRDIKGSNVLVNGNGVVKLADFGLARFVNTEVPHVRYTNRVISLWYRPPELLLGSEHYGYEVDVWSVGCLFVEVFNRTPLFHGKDEVSQIQAIYTIMGHPKDNDWPEHESLPWNSLIESLAPWGSVPTYRLDRVFSGPHITNACFDLAKKLLSMNPRNRISAAEALRHPYFSEEPKEEKLTFEDGSEWHDWEAKQRTREKEEIDD